MKKVGRQKMDDSSPFNVYRSYSDMMSGLLLLFVLIMAVCLMQAQKNYTEKLAEQAALIQSQSDLEDAQSQLSTRTRESQLATAQAQLSEQESELNAQESTLAEQAATLEQLQKVLEQQQASLNEKESEVDAKDAQLSAQAQQLSESQTQLDQANALMQEQQARIDQIIGVKADLIAALNQEFTANQINVQIDTQTGAILLDSSVLFDFNESVLTQAGQAILDQVLPIYCQVLLGGEYADYIAEVIIDGYTDSSGDYLTNLQLSQNRAYAVAQYLLSTMYNFLSADECDTLMAKLTANGKSSSNPILTSDGQEDADASRRVEIKFRLKDEEMMSELQSLISSSQSGTGTADTSTQETEAAAATSETTQAGTSDATADAASSETSAEGTTADTASPGGSDADTASSDGSDAGTAAATSSDTSSADGASSESADHAEPAPTG